MSWDKTSHGQNVPRNKTTDAKNVPRRKSPKRQNVPPDITSHRKKTSHLKKRPTGKTSQGTNDKDKSNMTNNKNNLIGSTYKLRSLPNIHMWPGELALSCNPSYLGGKNCGMVCGKMIARTAYRKLALLACDPGTGGTWDRAHARTHTARPSSHNVLLENEKLIPYGQDKEMA